MTRRAPQEGVGQPRQPQWRGRAPRAGAPRPIARGAPRARPTTQHANPPGMPAQSPRPDWHAHTWPRALGPWASVPTRWPSAPSGRSQSNSLQPLATRRLDKPNSDKLDAVGVTRAGCEATRRVAGGHELLLRRRHPDFTSYYRRVLHVAGLASVILSVRNKEMLRVPAHP